MEELSHKSSKKKYLPLKFNKKDSHVLRSSFTSRLSLMQWFGKRTPTVKSIRRLKKARPGLMTEQAKFKRPLRDCTSFKVTFLRWIKSEIREIHFPILSRGRRASKKMESNSIPANDMIVEGPQVFSGAMGIPVRAK